MRLQIESANYAGDTRIGGLPRSPRMKRNERSVCEDYKSWKGAVT